MVSRGPSPCCGVAGPVEDFIDELAHNSGHRPSSVTASSVSLRGAPRAAVATRHVYNTCMSILSPEKKTASAICIERQAAATVDTAVRRRRASRVYIAAGEKEEEEEEEEKEEEEREEEELEPDSPANRWDSMVAVNWRHQLSRDSHPEDGGFNAMGFCAMSTERNGQSETPSSDITGDL
ncbi:hypothetical protein EYF80_032651 [Liparis tanakae]|uniref:Uncharacterized protein n=1 Tax=Liparis tanakae TaxID=230148 RepID=A0A4Z2GU74_9TELE|nr:hypothetical protein EYF80_032651 [Liparis tanakae]